MAKRKIAPFGSDFSFVVSISRILLSIVIYLGLELLQSSSGTPSTNYTTLFLLQKGTFCIFKMCCNWCSARPCIEVRILPFQPDISAGLLLTEFLSFRLGRLCSHLSCCHGRALPATILYDTKCRTMFGLSSPPLISQKRSNYPAQLDYYNIIPCNLQ